MKIKNLLALPIAAAVDVLTLNTFEVTESVIRSDIRENEVDAINAVAKIIELREKQK